MKVFFWEPDSEGIATELTQKGGDFKYLSISSWEELKSACEEDGGDELSMVFIDADGKPGEVEQIVQDIKGQFPHFIAFISTQSLAVEQLAELEQKGMEVEAFLRRPHQVDAIFELINKHYSELLTDNPINMKKGGTASIDMRAILNARNAEEGAEDDTPTEEIGVEFNLDGGEGQEDDQTQILSTPQGEDPSLTLSLSGGGDEGGEAEEGEKTVTSLEEMDGEKTGFTLEGEQNEEGGVEVHVANDVVSQIEQERDGEEKDSAEESASDEGSGALELTLGGTDIFDIPGELTEEIEAHVQEEREEQERIEQGEEVEAQPEAELEVKAEHEPAVESEAESDADEAAMSLQLPSEPVASEAVGGGEDDDALVGVDLDELKRESESISKHHSDELLHLKATIENLREERELLLKKTGESERIENEFKYKINALQAELDEKKIEVIFLKKRYEKDMEELKYSAKLSREKKDILLEKNKQLQQELELAESRVAFDLRKVQEREKMLAGQLELLKSDSESLLKGRDKMILELKRKIDTLEFDFETVSQREKKVQEDKYLLEDRLERIMRTLRRTIGNLDEDLLAEKNEDEDKKLTGV